MILLSGNVGKLFVGYKPAATLKRWQLVRKNDTLGGQVARGQGVIDEVDALLITTPPTKLSLRLSNRWWSWHEVRLVYVVPVNGGTVTFEVTGDPEVQ